MTKTKVKLDLLTDNMLTDNMLLMVEKKGVRGGICRSNNKYMKDYDKNTETWYLQYWNVNNLYGYSMSKRFPVNSFE